MELANLLNYTLLADAVKDHGTSGRYYTSHAKK